MTLATLDWTIIGAYFVLVLAVGLAVSRKAGDSAQDFFLSGRNMGWLLLGVSMVATTFSADTPNLVTGLVRESGVAGNWGWWAFLLTGMLTVFVFAKLWRRANVMTDIEFYELRYSGGAAAFLRGFRALYLGLVFNVLVMGTVSLAAVKFGGIMLGWPGWQTLLIAGSITLAYSAFGGLKAVIITDFVQFILAMIGSIWACIYLLGLDEVGGIGNLLTHPEVQAKLSIVPSLKDPAVWVPVLLVPLAVQWWASYYPGAEPGGGGYIAQRMFSAKNERNAVGATLLFNIAHYALRPWPWILIALASIVVFPEVRDIQAAFPALAADKLGHDAAYPAMLSKLPVGLKGLVAASLIAAFMSTMSTQLNLGASYLVNDFYQRFLKPDASQKQLVNAGRLFTVVSMILGTALGLALQDATTAFNLLLLLGAGTGLIFILRWFWWRINAMTEIVAMVSSLVIAGFMTFGPLDLEGWQKTVIGALLTTVVWIVAAFFTPPTTDSKLFDFYKRIRPAGPGWEVVRRRAADQGVALPQGKGQLPLEISCMLIGCLTVYSALFSTGYWIYGKTGTALIFTVLTALGGLFLFSVWNKLKTDEAS
ncbi:MAG: Na+:solute symporter [Lewinellaceae bacterium]|nr:Na+:solute symporter [Lewinella sp.]MCB9278936.1 Na+:solute symporter [Lewinellaceae bacterium]